MKDHGEGGNIIGANPIGNVLIIDDVISAGTAAKESIESIKALGANPNLMIVGLDRQEKGQGSVSARAELENIYGMRVISIINLDALIQFSEKDPEYSEYLSNLKAYRDSWGA